VDGIEQRIRTLELWIDRWPPAAGDLLLLLAAILVGLVVHAIVFRVGFRVLAHRRPTARDHYATRLRRPSRFLFPVLAIQAVLPRAWWRADLADAVSHGITLAAIAGGAWVGVAFLGAVEASIKARHPVDVADNYNARRLHTQVTVVERTLSLLVVLLALAAALMTFPQVKEIGQALLASAGLVGIVVGFAARPVLENLIAGLQIALTHPINIDDVVIVEGEWGWIEQITSTYVVVRVWDQRRLIVPFSKFISESFQNWTRRTSDILGTVLLHLDYRTPLAPLREEMLRVTGQNKYWDGRVCVLQVTDATERTMTVRILLSAANSPAAWELRVHVREKLIEFLQREYPESLPRLRVETGAGGGQRPPDEAAEATSSSSRTS